MTDFLLELRSEEIPARMQDKARADLSRLFEGELAKAGLKAGAIETYATPRRLALIARDLPLETQAVSEETKGPKVTAPPQALEGFLRKTGLRQDQLIDRDGTYFAVVEKAGRATADVLGEAIPAIIRAFPWPKSQRWGAASISTESLRWVRPLQGIVALLGDVLVPCEVDGIVSGSTTTGHRFHHHGDITIGNAADYALKLRAAHVILDQNERAAIIRAGAAKAADDAGLVLVQDEGLVSENAGLTEWPVPMLGRFDAAFLEVPEEVIQLTARVNQKYFVCLSSNGKLANAFVCTANLSPSDGGASVIAGNEKVLAARLSDAKFFWEADLKVSLEDQAKKLSNIVFHEKLGSVADKVERVAKLARWLVESGVIKSSPSTCDGEGDRSKSGGGETAPPSVASAPATSPSQVDREDLAAQAETAARLCKADLVTGMVGEFPELQGIMGGYYARAQGHCDAVADAIRDHYKPVGQGDDVPTAPVTVAVSLADKLDTIANFFAVGEMPSGSRDPFALRRAAIGAIALIRINELRVDLIFAALQAAGEGVLKRHYAPGSEAIREAIKAVGKAFDAQNGLPIMDAIGEVIASKKLEVAKQTQALIDVAKMTATVRDFFIDRLEQSERSSGYRIDIIRSCFVIDGDRGRESDLVRLLARVKALQAFVGTGEGANLLAAYKRAANILKSSEKSPSPSGEGLGVGDVRQAAARVDTPHPNPSPEGEGLDYALESALSTAEPLATAAIAAEDFEAAMSALASLRAPIDAFFDEGGMVNNPDPAVRAYRLGLLTRFRDAVHKVADFSKIEG